MVPRGLILVTGATGSGKTTTLAAMIDHINEHQAAAHRDGRGPDRVRAPRTSARSSTSAKSAPTPAASLGALRRALRQDPDVILIGEMRDEETVRTALSAAETGHLVLSTLHTIDVMETIYRIARLLPGRARAAGAGDARLDAEGIISQRLVRDVDGRSRVPASR